MPEVSGALKAFVKMTVSDREKKVSSGVRMICELDSDFYAFVRKCILQG